VTDNKMHSANDAHGYNMLASGCQASASSSDYSASSELLILLVAMADRNKNEQQTLILH